MSVSLTNAQVVTGIDAQGERFMRVVPDMAAGAWSDEDWGRPARHVCSRSASVWRAERMGSPIPSNREPGGTTPGDLANPKTNCAKLAAAPVWLTMSPGPVDPCPTDRGPQLLPLGSHCPPAHDSGAVSHPLLNSWAIFAWGENAQIHKWKVSAVGELTYANAGP